MIQARVDIKACNNHKGNYNYVAKMITNPYRTLPSHIGLRFPFCIPLIYQRGKNMLPEARCDIKACNNPKENYNNVAKVITNPYLTLSCLFTVLVERQ